MAAPRSKQFDDVYFSAENGFEETHHVFIRGNRLPENWMGRAAKGVSFVIAETGFGTGLNFLCTWKLFNETAPGGRLEFISFEKFPLIGEEIFESLKPWEEYFAEELKIFIEKYPSEHSGTHRIAMSGNVVLTLIFDDVNEALPKLNETVDCWFLDGFKPRSNPEMWTETVFQNMARLSRPGTTFATFTAAGFVGRGLRAAGFDVKKIKGYGSKWHMLAGVKL